MPTPGVSRDVTLKEYRLRVLKRADRPGALKRWPPAEVNRILNEAIGDFYDVCIGARGPAAFARITDPIPTAFGTIRYAIPDDVLQVLSVRMDLGGTNTFMLEPFEDLEEGFLLVMNQAGGALRPRYRLRHDDGGQYMDIIPNAQLGNMYVRYLPTAPVLYGDEDTFNAWNIGTGHEYIVCEAARQIATSDQEWELVAALKDDLARLKSRIQSIASHRDAGRPPRVVDVRPMRLPFGRRITW